MNFWWFCSNFSKS